VSKKYIIDDVVTLDKNRTNDFKRSKEENNQQQLHSATTNTVQSLTSW